MNHKISLKNFIPWIIVRLTKEARYLPEIQWSDKSWTHNVFRVYEMIFWRKHGIRAEMTAGAILMPDGTQRAYEVAHTFEAACAIVETQVRNSLTSGYKLPTTISSPYLIPSPYVKFAYRFAPVAVFALLLGKTTPFAPFVLAIAYDNRIGAIPAAGATPISTSMTLTGSDRALASAGSGGQSPTTTCTSVTYNAVALTQVGTVIDTVGSGVRTYLHLLTNPASGSNTITATWSSGSAPLGATSYTGVNATGNPDAFSTTAEATTTTFTQAVTVVASNCWLVATSRCASGTTPTGSGGSNVRLAADITINGGGCIWDSNATVGTGSQNISVTSASQLYGGGVAMSIKPVAIASTNPNFLSFFM